MRIYKRTVRLALLFLITIWVVVSVSSSANGQQDSLRNGSMEDVTEGGLPEFWSVFSNNPRDLEEAGVRYAVESENPTSGKNCLLVDTNKSKMSSVGAWQQINAKEYAGKRVMLRASIRVDIQEEDEDESSEDEEEVTGSARLSIGVFRTDPVGYFRPIAGEYAGGSVSNDHWKRCSIVIDVPKNAEVIEIGLEVFGKTKAWFDDVSIDVVSPDRKLTSPSPFDKPQSFFTWWLILPVIAISMFVFGFCGRGRLQRFAMRFSVAYWVMYYLDWCLGLLSFTQFDLSDYYRAIPGFVTWFTWNVFEKNVYPMSSGSGDGLFNYAEAFSIFAFSIGIAIVWSFLDWRKTDYVWLKDLLRSFLRYSLAIVLMSYGLAKLFPEFSQFPPPSFHRMSSRFGDASPMGLLWTFMGASQPYTIFAGAGEVTAALLLIWRRTVILGGLVAIGVMTNVVMLNFCYDVPVKLFSTHLLITAIVILVPDASRISKAFLTHGAMDKVDLSPPFVAALHVWWYRALKFGLIVLSLIYPTYEQLDTFSRSKAPDFFGDYIVEKFESPHVSNDAATEIADSDTSEPGKFQFLRLPYQMDEDQEQVYTDIISISSARGSSSRATVKLNGQTMEVVDFQGRKKALPDTFKVNVVAEDLVELEGELDQGKWLVQLRRRKGEFLLSSRGFRWVNQRPFNR